ncbi:MAG: hypothetical protein IH624_05005 [Phycisphaerae bacterium]|nr:hypothetical protein [Phycisphaerae bacterium]
MAAEGEAAAAEQPKAAAEAAVAAPAAPAADAVVAAEPTPVAAADEAAATDPPAELELSEILDRLGARLARGDATAAKAGAGPAKVGVSDAVAMTPVRVMPADSTKLVELPKLSKVEINEISDRLVMHLGAQLNYVGAGALSDALPVPPSGVVGDRTIARTVDGNAYILRFGYRHFVTQPAQLWAIGLVVDKDGNMTANPDLALIEPEIGKMVTSLNAMRAGLEVRDLEPKLIQLSYVEPATAIDMLAGLGITTMAKPSDVPAKIDFAKLPFVVKIDDPKAVYTGLIGAGAKIAAGKLSMSPGIASDMTDNAIATPMTQLLVMFHPAHPEQFSRVRQALDNFIDRPARQIFIEGMVLEISELGLKDLGVDWQLRPYLKDDGTPIMSLKGGSAFSGDSLDTLNLLIPDSSTFHNIFSGKFQWDWQIQLRALIRSGKAQILSRPSVLTLDNRQSTIRVGKDIPIAQSFQGLNVNAATVSFSFDYLPIGILLNIRPRINESGKEVTMLIDTIVSARVPNEDLEMRTTDGKTVLAKAPTVSTRRVQTYGRIANNTPLIIGGLVANEQISVKDKVPLLGDLPLLGAAFRSEKSETEKREVIIVLTPHVLPEHKEVRRSFPKDEDAFDNFGNDLFRDSYRIRSEDVFDLTFLLENRRISLYRRLARQAAEKNFRLSRREPFRSFVEDTVPGESILTARMIYEVVKRLDIAAPVDASRVIYFGSQQVGGYDVKWLHRLLNDSNGRLKDFGGKALAITYHPDRTSLEEGRMGSEPIPHVEMVDCPDKKTWGEKLWELNQPEADGRQRYTILIQDESDVVRLRRALALKRIVVLNGGIDQMRLKNFSVGKTLLMPELKKDQVHVLDSDTAMFFFQTEHYYAAALQEIETQLKELDTLLRRPDINILLDSSLPEIVPSGRNFLEGGAE